VSVNNQQRHKGWISKAKEPRPSAFSLQLFYFAGGGATALAVLVTPKFGLNV
jgi:hypothetical protein